ncbi:MAG TPA: AarF/UbiB family protein [Ktedonobacterales bacterium]|nr:AarF/UbiB family protein [Ktedonobacterales bacterium]
MIRQWQTWTRRNTIWRSYRVGRLLLRTLYTINRERTRVVRAHARGDDDVRPNIEALLRVLREFRHTAVDLGGLLIKLGQFLGARADLLPEEALAELAALHDDVPPERFEDITAVLEHEWKAPLREVVAVIESKPAGSASLGQVHRARLHDGRDVAIKVQRPGIGAIVRTDLRTLRFVLRVVGWLAPAATRIVDLGALYREFSRTVAEELDYQHEGRNAERFAAIFADDPRILVPAVIAEHSTRHGLVLQWMDGIKVTETDALDAAGVDRAALANQLMGAYLKQVLDIGFFHADPHPGNIFVQASSDGDRLVFLDFGMMGVITQRMRAGLRDCFAGVVARDGGLIVRGVDALGFLGEAADRRALERVVDAMLARFSAAGGTGGLGGHGGSAPFARQPRGADPRAVYGDIEATLYDQPLRLPANLAFFGRMAGMLLGLTASLAPEFDFIAVATPYAQQFMGTGGIEGILRLLGVESVEVLGRDLLRDGVATLRSLATLPRRLDHVLELAERGELHLTDASTPRARGRGVRPARRPVAGVLSRPVPVWVPVSLVGAFALTQLVRRVLKPRR